MPVSFDIPREDVLIVKKIVDRANALYMKLRDESVDRLSLHMDITACHANGCPLQLRELLEAADDFNFAHDVFGISRHLNRTTGKLEDCFVPRYAQPQPEVARHE